jgi:hypothetical protein
MVYVVYTISVTETGVEREFSISEKIMKQRNLLNPTIIRNLMQYKRWIARYGRIGDIVTDEDESSEEELELGSKKDNKVNKELLDWLKNWERKQKSMEQARRFVSS